MTEGKFTITAGLIPRRAIRRFLLEERINFIEEKGWIDSAFYLTCTQETYNMVARSLENWQKEINSSPVKKE